jgi:hypothetical protein
MKYDHLPNPFEDMPKLASSSAVERGAVNAYVAGSSPALPAKRKRGPSRYLLGYGL